MTKIKTVFFDMDGVLVDQEEGLASAAGMTLQTFQWRRRLLRRPNYDLLMAELEKNIHKGILEHMRPTLAFYDLMRWQSLWRSEGRVYPRILSSASKSPFYQEIVEQKLNWLGAHCPTLTFDAEFPRGSSEKKLYAREDALLIDDTLWVVEEFRENGGNAIWFDVKNKKDVMEQLNDFGLETPDELNRRWVV